MSAQAGEESVHRRLKESRLHYPQGLNPTRTDHPISFGRDDYCGGFGDSMFEDDVHDLPSLVPCEESLDSRQERLYQLFTEPNDWEGDEDWHDDPEEMNLPDVAETGQRFRMRIRIVTKTLRINSQKPGTHWSTWRLKAAM